MNGPEVLRIVDAIHRDKNIDKEIVFEGIEQAILSAARKHFGEDEEVIAIIDRETGEPSLSCDGELLDADLLGDLLGRVSAQTAKQVMIQKIREAERDALFDEYMDLKSQIVSGTISRIEHGSATVSLGKVDGFLPRGEQIPGESHRVGERIRAVVMDVRKAGSRVKIILSRNHPDLVRRLFELEIPEVNENVIDVRSLAREAGYRSKVAVFCYDTKIDSVGACVGVRGSRIKSIVDELAGERIDIVRWNDSLQILVPNALQPAEVEDVILCPRLGKVIVLVRDDQLSLAIGKKGQNVRLASKLVGWDINVMTQDRLDEQLERSVTKFSSVPGMSEDLSEVLVAEGFFSFDDLSVIEPDQLAELGGLTEAQCNAIVEFADEKSIVEEEEERQAAQEARRGAQLANSAGAFAAKPVSPSPPAKVAADESSTPDSEGTEVAGTAEVIETAAVENSESLEDGYETPSAEVEGSATAEETPESEAAASADDTDSVTKGTISTEPSAESPDAGDSGEEVEDCQGTAESDADALPQSDCEQTDEIVASSLDATGVAADGQTESS